MMNESDYFIEDEDMWDVLGIRYGGYNSAVDNDIVAVLKAIMDDKPTYTDDIAIKTGLSETHVELIQYILCHAGIMNYGTSPRGCWVEDDKKAAKVLQLAEEAWK